MDLLKSQFERIQQQLGELTASQKMLAGSLVAVMVLTLMFWGRYAGESELEPLLAQAMAPEDLKRISQQLDQGGVKYELSGDRILVPADKQAKIMATLVMADALPQNTSNGFDEIIKKISPWDGQDRQDKMFQRGKELFLSEVIGNFPDVLRAQVSVDKTSKRVIGATAPVEPTAFVNITMKPGTKATKKLVHAAARIVSGAQAGLPLRNIQVVVNGAHHRVLDDGDGQDFDPDKRQEEEERLSRRVLALMSDIPGLQVAVSVRVNTEDVMRKRTTYDDKTSIYRAKHEESESKEQTGAAAPLPADPGAGTNLGNVSISSATPETAITSSHEKTDYELLPSMEEFSSRVKAGEVVPVSASVRVPRSYFVHIAKRGDAAAKEPDDKAVQSVIDVEMPRISAQVANCALLKGPEVVAASAYYDQIPTPPEPAAATAGGTVTAILTSHTKEVALAALACISLFMVSMIVKKSSPAATALAGAAGGAGGAATAAATRLLDGGELVAGEAGSGKPLLDGMELDENAVRTQQMLDQVSTLVDENPEAAASLVRRWMNRS
jgi:flagellar biosynthesis/type III secretory pathway M-ring protein FliF/YscJ